MNILISNQTGLVRYGTDSSIYQLGDSWACNGVKIGILFADATLVENVESPALFIIDVYSYANSTWTIVNQEVYDAVVEGNKIQFNAAQKKKREDAYKAESDQINFMYQRGEATQQEWLNKIAEIKTRYPYQE
jgi:hypothetical protein